MARMRSLTAIVCCLASAILILNGCSGSYQGNDGRTSNQANTDTVGRPGENRVKVFSAGTGNQTVVRNVPAEELSVIYVVSQSEVELLMTGPGGRRTGKDPDSSKPFEEIPNSSYYSEYIEDPEGEGGMEARHLEIRRPADGNYLLSVFGTRAGKYGLGIRLYDIKGNPHSWDRSGIPAEKGSVHTYHIGFRKDGSGEFVDADTLK